MTALLELKQRIKNLYGQYEIYILPFLRFVCTELLFFVRNMMIARAQSITAEAQGILTAHEAERRRAAIASVLFSCTAILYSEK